MGGISCSDYQLIISYHKMSFSYNSRNLMVNYADVMRKKCVKEATVHDIQKELCSIFLTTGQPF